MTDLPQRRSDNHSADAAADPMPAGRLAQMAAAWIGRTGIQANIITSMGLAATQTVFHT